MFILKHRSEQTAAYSISRMETTLSQNAFTGVLRKNMKECFNGEQRMELISLKVF